MLKYSFSDFPDSVEKIHISRYLLNKKSGILLKNKTVDCIICPDVNTGLILNPNYKNIIDRINYGLMIIFSVLGAIIVVISIASILVCACKK